MSEAAHPSPLTYPYPSQYLYARMPVCLYVPKCTYVIPPPLFLIQKPSPMQLQLLHVMAYSMGWRMQVGGLLAKCSAPAAL